MNEEISLRGRTTMVRIIHEAWIKNLSCYVVSIGVVTKLEILIRDSTTRGCTTSSANERAAK